MAAARGTNHDELFCNTNDQQLHARGAFAFKSLEQERG
jgi:hypothetical protein